MIGSLYNLGLKYEVMEHYSKGVPYCLDCGCHDLHVLELDHSNDDGLEERLRYSNGRGSSNYWGSLRRRGYPDDLGLEVRCQECHKKRRKLKQIVDLSYATLSIEFDYDNPIPHHVEQHSLLEVMA